ncbi:MAG: preprotein translocase subunit SecG [Proteobacteria bacterium]|nr:preprotein translocase subunit SecG [Pseudomonadota bacterium]MCH8809114.1 preprotein translocase subunit SecG [Pseudomonadota bacterium]MCH9013243.1 preprotein translocase subunit SecG [Pseudomonadota bacterium]
MSSVLVVIHLMLAMAMIGVVLLQRSEGGGLGIGGGGGGGGMSGFLTGRGTANLLTRATAVLAAGFMLTSIGLTILASDSGDRRSIIDEPPVTAPVQEQPSAPSVPVQ